MKHNLRYGFILALVLSLCPYAGIRLYAEEETEEPAEEITETEEAPEEVPQEVQEETEEVISEEIPEETVQEEETFVPEETVEEISEEVIAEPETYESGLAIIYEDSNGYCYDYDNYRYLSGLQTIEGKIYYFDPDTYAMVRSCWKTVSGKKYYFKADGSAEKGWKKWNGSLYFLDRKTAVMATGVKTIDGKIYGFDSSGRQIKGWQKISGKWYFFKANGAAEKGWKQYNGKWYFLDRSTAVMATGVKTIDGKIYGFNSSGAMLKGWQKMSGKWYFFKSNGAAEKGWKKSGGKWYFLDRSTAVMATGVKTIDGKVYGFNSSGAMVTGWQQFSGKWYFFKSNGAAEKGWKKWKGKWYYLSRLTGVMLTGLRKVDGKQYYLDSFGAMITGWKYLNNKWYFFGSSGALQPDKTPWPGYLSLPSRSEINAFHTSERSPYIVCDPDLDGASSYTEYVVDFRADYLPRGTYLSVCDWDMDLTSLKQKYYSVWRDYNNSAAYAGFQVLSDGSHVAIMSVWNTYIADRSGNTGTIKPKVVYPAGKGKPFTGEGNGVQCIVPYNWKEGKTYRALIQTYQENGTTRMDFWVCDLATKEWTNLVNYDTGIADQKMLPDMVAFLECFETDYAGELRSMELFNIKARSADTGEWIAAKRAHMNNQIFKYGSYSFGSYKNRFWAITTGLKNRGDNTSGSPAYSVDSVDMSDPY